jgi:hypothetical protein
MTVRAHKPEFNFREKLKELDYAHVPYHKMPAGSVIKTEYRQFDTRLTINHGGTLQYTPFSDLNIDITPVSSSSKFLMHANIVSGEGQNPNGGPAFRYEYGGNSYFGNGSYSYTTSPNNVSSFINVDDLITTAFTTSGNNWQYLSKSYHGSALVEPNTTDPITFQLGYHGVTTLDVNRNAYTGQSNNWGGGFTTLTVMEIAG